MTPIDTTRRRFLLAGAVAPVALAFGGSAWAADQAACYDPAAQPLAQKRQRRAIGYVEPSPDAKKRCGGCAFFTATKAGCGTCQLLSGGPVVATAVCNSFAPKAR